MLEVLSTIIETICVIVATFVGIQGLNTWRFEIVGKRKSELAEEVLAMFYEAKDIFVSVRFPAGFSNEGQTRTSRPEETEEEKNNKNVIFVPVERLHKHHEFFGRLAALRYRFKAYFGKEAEQPFEKIKEVHGRIAISSRMLITTYVRNEENRSDLVSQRQRWESDIGGWLDEDQDILSTKINESIEAIEKICVPQLSGKKST